VTVLTCADKRDIPVASASTLQGALATLARCRPVRHACAGDRPSDLRRAGSGTIAQGESPRRAGRRVAPVVEHESDRSVTLRSSFAHVVAGRAHRSSAIGGANHLGSSAHADGNGSGSSADEAGLIYRAPDRPSASDLSGLVVGASRPRDPR